MSDFAPWYELAVLKDHLTQGEIIMDCPLITWNEDLLILDGGELEQQLRSISIATRADVIIMTQACDLENKKVVNVVLCPHISLSKYKQDWETNARSNNQEPSPRSWRSHCESIKDGYRWNMSMLNHGSVNGVEIERRIVEFNEIYTIPRVFLENLIQERADPRLRLKPPYREHLSQAFARYFMRVGLPVAVNSEW